MVNAESATQYFKNSKETILAYEEWMDGAAPLYEKIIDGMVNSTTLTDSIEFKIPTGIRHLPKYEFVKTTVEDAFFEKLEAGVQERLVGKVDNLDQYLNELEKECAIIVPNGLCDYFMILWDIMHWCREQGIMTGSGRGSVCGSLIAYCLYITDVDPLKYNLMFERFLNSNRVTVPKFWDLEIEGYGKFRLPENAKIPLRNGEEIDIDCDLSNIDLDIDIDKLRTLCKV